MSRVVTNTFWLYVAQIGGLIIPLIELPFLARSLGQENYGLVLYSLGIALTASVFVEFGFIFSAARSAVDARHDRARLAQLVADVLLAKVILSAVVMCLIAVYALSGAGATRIPPEWLIWIALAIFGFGFSPIWYYIAIERLILPALLDVGLRSVGLILVIMLVRSPGHAERVLMIHALVGAANTLIPTALMFRQTGFGRVRVSGALLALQQSMEIFLYKGAQNILGSLASTILGALGGARAVGAFVPAEKLIRATSGLAGPLFNVIFPHAVSLRNEPSAARSLTMSVMVLMSIGCVVFAIITMVLAEWIVKLVFGPGYEEAVILLKILVWVLPLRIASTALAMLWFIPLGRESIASRAMVFNIFTVIILAAILVPPLGGYGMTLAFLVSESVMLAVLLTAFLRKPRNQEARS